MCWCAHTSVYYALLSLLRHAKQLKCIAALAAADPLVTASLSCLPNELILSGECVWEKSFAAFMQRRTEDNKRYHYVTSSTLREVGGAVQPEDVAVFHMNRAPPVEGQRMPSTRQRPRSQLFADYQRSLSAEQQAELAKWATGDYSMAGARQSAAGRGEERKSKAARIDHQSCAAPPAVYHCFDNDAGTRSQYD